MGPGGRCTRVSVTGVHVNMVPEADAHIAYCPGTLVCAARNRGWEGEMPWEAVALPTRRREEGPPPLFF